MKTQLLDYDLPQELIAQTPAEKRTASRLLVLHRTDGRLQDRMFNEVTEYLRSGDCMVFNNTKVLPARFYFQRSTGTRMEALFLSEVKPGLWQVMIKNARRIKTGETLAFLNRDNTLGPVCTALERVEEGHWRLQLQNTVPAESVLQTIGFAPLPPYIKRDGQHDPIMDDLSRYQTVFAEKPGAIAAPTAGLHFDQALLDKIATMHIYTARCTLHVGTGTFKPVQTENLEDHPIHTEFYDMPPDAAQTINTARHSGSRIIAVGTTSVRTLESAAHEGKAAASTGHTQLFITPGYRFKLVDGMITNFHLPRSTLLSLVAAFAGLDMILDAYRHAIDRKYRFYSYGDAMMII
ncbi:MAG: tRNA preQ1(34) S-adenosylmethionine ribosyltransferase-isomerase QueA [Sedimentisphaerales bacterium]|nr:tRNA preQ1(34) S-adenosylmethionine ribosyltransferase-isomerase QueA [Sedimentisphaerales bacterium]